MRKNNIVRRSNEKKRRLTIGVDLGDRSSRYCILDEQGEVILEGCVATTKKGLAQVFGSKPRSRIALEVGTHSPWVSRYLAELGHEVVVANTRRVRLITESSQKNDLCLSKTPCRVKWLRTRACESLDSPSVLLPTKGYGIQRGYQWRLVVSRARKRPERRTSSAR